VFKVLTSGNQAWHWEITELNEVYSWENDPLPTTSTTKHVTKEKSVTFTKVGSSTHQPQSPAIPSGKHTKKLWRNMFHW